MAEEREENREHEQNGQDEGINFKKSTIILLLLLVLLGILRFSGEPDLTSQCIEAFNNSHCDSSNPIGSLCNELYDCILRESGKRSYHTEEVTAENDESWIEEIVVATLLSAASSYFIGLKRMTEILYFASVISGQIIKALWRKMREKISDR